jgi:hypothetical protein
MEQRRHGMPSCHHTSLAGMKVVLNTAEPQHISTAKPQHLSRPCRKAAGSVTLGVSTLHEHAHFTF